MNKIWHKPLHKRKVWKRMSLYDKAVYYLQPFMLHLIDTWRQPLPFPTLFKIAFSGFIMFFMLLPVILPMAIIISYYAMFQYLIESALGIVYPKNLDILHKVFTSFNFETENEAAYNEYLNLYWQKWQYITTVCISGIDYIRLALAVMTN